MSEGRLLERSEYELLARLQGYCEQWQGEIVKITIEDWPFRTDYGWVLGHDGPVYRDGLWYPSNRLQGFGGWGAVVFHCGGGTTRYTDPDLIVKTVKETAWCPFDCKDGWCPWALDDGAEYEHICRAHRPDEYAEAEDLYLKGWDDRSEKQEQRLRDLTDFPEGVLESAGIRL